MYWAGLVQGKYGCWTDVGPAHRTARHLQLREQKGANGIEPENGSIHPNSDNTVFKRQMLQNGRKRWREIKSVV